MAPSRNRDRRMDRRRRRRRLRHPHRRRSERGSSRMLEWRRSSGEQGQRRYQTELERRGRCSGIRPEGISFWMRFQANYQSGKKKYR